MHNLSTKKKVLLIVGSFVLLAAISVVTALVLSIGLSKQSDSEASVKIPADQIIQSYRTAYTAGNLQRAYVEQTDSLKNGIITYAPTSGTSYATQLPASNSITYVRNDTKDIPIPPVLISDAEAFLATQGLTKDTSTLTNTTAQILFNGATSVCQITTFKVVTDSTIFNSPAAFGIGCTDKKAVTDEYSAIDSLLTLYKATDSVPAMTQANRHIVQNETTPITILSVTPSDVATGSIRAYFVSIEGQQKFVGTQSIPAPSATDRTVIQSAEFKAALVDPAYGTLLSQTIEKY